MFVPPAGLEQVIQSQQRYRAKRYDNLDRMRAKYEKYLSDGTSKEETYKSMSQMPLDY